MLDRCPVHEAELSYDRKHGLTNAQEQALYAKEYESWKFYFEQLLKGLIINKKGSIYSLDEYVKNKYPVEFLYWIDNDINLIEFFSKGKSMGGFFEAEARTLASIIVGE